MDFVSLKPKLKFPRIDDKCRKIQKYFLFFLLLFSFKFCFMLILPSPQSGIFALFILRLWVFLIVKSTLIMLDRYSLPLCAND